MGIHFLESSTDLLVLDTRDIADKVVVDTLYKIEELGLKQYNNFVKERLIERVKRLDDIISKNLLPLFSTLKKRQKTKAQEMMSEVKSDRNLSQDCMLHAKFGMATWKKFSRMKISHAHHLCQTEENSD